VNNVIEFPKKIFGQWGAIAQEIISLLRSAGANKMQADLIVERMRMKWHQCQDWPAVTNSQVFDLFPADVRSIHAHLYLELDNCTSRQMHSMNAKTLLKLAGAEFHRFSSSNPSGGLPQ
jgi:hypothetical protein